MNRPARPRRIRLLPALAAALLVAAGAAARAGPGIALAERRSGYDLMSPQTRAMQDDDAGNPATLWVLEGEALWNRKAGADAPACADCHGDARAAMRGVAARYPAFDAAAGRPLDLEQRIDRCRTQHQKAPAYPFESRELLALTAYVARQSRGLPIDITVDARTAPFLAAGRAAFERRRGQLDLACAQCHDDNWTRHLAGSAITQGQPTGYPIYRLEWQGMGSLQRRLRACIGGLRAAIDDYGAPELVDLELFLMWRARGMTLESPGVRP